MLTHAAYTTGKYTHGYVGLVYSRMEIGVPIFFVLSGFLLFGPWVRAAASGGPPPSVRRYAWHRVRRIMPAYVVTVLAAYVALPLPHGGTESRPHLDGVVPQPHADADLHRRLPVFVSAPRPYADVEPGRRGRVLRGAAAAGVPAAGGAVPSAVAPGAVARPGCWRLALVTPGVADRWCTPPTSCPTVRGCGCRRI